MDVQKYLERLKYEGTQKASLDTLCQLHRAHVSNIPFENLDIHYKQWIELDVDKFYAKVVERKRGGFCYELNGLFYEALKELGFQAYFISCSVYIQPLEKFGPYFAHVAIVVELDETLWLVDVGFGSSFPKPLKIELDTPQLQNDVLYILRNINETEILLDRSFDGGSTFTPMYKFTLVPRQLKNFRELCVFHQTSAQSPLFQKKLCSIATNNGRITLTSNHLIITKNRERTEVEIKDERDFQEKLSTYFSIHLPLQSP